MPIMTYVLTACRSLVSVCFQLGYHLSSIWVTLSHSSWTSQNLIQNGHALGQKKRIDVCGDSLVFGVSGLMSDVQGDVCVVAKAESWYQCHAIIRMWAPKGHCVCMNPEELQLSGWFS